MIWSLLSQEAHRTIRGGLVTDLRGIGLSPAANLNHDVLSKQQDLHATRFTASLS
jgi:hypothetical protein